jgi:prolipoprotein diacylglyceryltransferase
MTELNPLHTTWYEVFYVLAFAAALGLSALEGARRGWRLTEWLAVLALAGAAGIVGSKFIFFDFAAAASGAKTVLGGMLAGVLTLFAATRFLRFERGAADALVLAVPVGLALGRVGCLLAGCCFGHPAEVPWAVTYAPASPAFAWQLQSGLIGPAAAASLPVHPTQLYEALFALAVAGVLLRARRHATRPGATALAGLALLAGGRLVVEFYRARSIEPVAGLTTVQWSLAACVALAGLALWRVQTRRTPTEPRAAAPLWRHALVALATPALLIAGADLFAPVERIALTVLALPPLLAVAAMPRLIGFAAARGGVPVVSVLVLLQADTLRLPVTEWRFGGGVATGAHTITRAFVTGEDFGCGPSTLWADFDAEYDVVGGSLSTTQHTSAGRSHTVMLRGFAGTARMRPRAAEPAMNLRELTGTLAAGAVAGRLDHGWWGVTLGAGHGRLELDSPREWLEADDGGPSRVLGIIGGRLGRHDGLHVVAGVNDIEPLTPGHPGHLALGYGLPDGSRVRGGWLDEGLYASGTFARRSFEVEPLVGWDGVRGQPHARLMVQLRLGAPHR